MPTRIFSLAMVACVIGLGIIDEEIAFTGPLTRFASSATVSLASNYHANTGKWVLLALVLRHLGSITFVSGVSTGWSAPCRTATRNCR